jgi:hypothetical protein
MREVRCPHCDATNRRPRCGRCEKELEDPAAFKIAWKLYEHRLYVGIAGIVVALAITLWSPSIYIFSPSNFDECREQAARTARSNDAMRILIGVCSSKFKN